MLSLTQTLISSVGREQRTTLQKIARSQNQLRNGVHDVCCALIRGVLNDFITDNVIE